MQRERNERCNKRKKVKNELVEISSSYFELAEKVPKSAILSSRKRENEVSDEKKAKEKRTNIRVLGLVLLLLNLLGFGGGCGFLNNGSSDGERLGVFEVGLGLLSTFESDVGGKSNLTPPKKVSLVRRENQFIKNTHGENVLVRVDE